MYELTPSIIAEVTGGKCIGKRKMRNAAVVGAVRDNRDVKPGNLFVCICGERTDGHLYANSAYESGATCCLAEKKIPKAKGAYVLVKSTLEAIKTLAAFHRSHFDIPVIGITGSVGKTTAKELIAATLEAKFCVLKTEKNLNNELGVPLTLMSLQAKHEVAVIEMGISDFGEMGRLSSMVKPTVFMITNIGYSHTKELGDLEGVLRAKTEAVAYMNSDGVIVVNGDDEMLQAYNPGITKITFGLGDQNTYYADNIMTQGVYSIEMDIICGNEKLHVDIPAYGIHLAALAPAAVAAGQLLGLSDEQICSGMSGYAHLDGRSNISEVNGVTLIDDCYNANPSSVKAALTSLSEFSKRRVAILGDMLNLGNVSEELHREIGGHAAKCGVSLLLCHGDESRYILEGFIAAGGEQAQHYGEIGLLTADISFKIAKGDAVLVKASRDMHFERILPVISDLKWE